MLIFRLVEGCGDGEVAEISEGWMYVGVKLDCQSELISTTVS